MDPHAGLNLQQREATLATEGPLLVLAGAGAGKTKVIAHRILEIIRRGAAPTEVLAITFTNKAASEMRARVRSLLSKHQGFPLGSPLKGNPWSGGPLVSTFHSLGLMLIKENYRLLGLKRHPTVYDRADSLREVKRALKEAGEEFEPRSVLGTLSKQKGAGVGVEEYREQARTPYERAVAVLWERYERALQRDGAMDFDDLLLRAVQLLERPEVRTQYRRRWRYLLIDEYQDTNLLQARMAELLVGEEQNVCAVGDIDQTIYSWRGAQIENLLQFEHKYRGAKTVVLEENYRSTKTILAAANDVIRHNQNRVEKNLFTQNGAGAKVALYQAFDEEDEAGFVVRTIQEMLRRGPASAAEAGPLQPRDFALLYRANFQSAALERQLLAAGVSYQVLGTKFFERKEVKDTLSFIKAALFETPADIGRIANTPPRGIGKVTLAKMLSGEPAGEKAAQFVRLLQHIREAASELPPQLLIKFVIGESGLEQALREDRLEGAERLENLRELASIAERHPDIQSVLESAALASDQDELKEEQNSVRLMTVHASKGLEFPVVFITGLEEGLFPYERGDDTVADREEERRLMYVALTRAKEKVYLTRAMCRSVFGSKQYPELSQFVGDINPELLEEESPERLGKTIYRD